MSVVKYRVEAESKKSDVIDVLNWLSIVRDAKCKVFLTIYMHQFGWLSERGVTF